MGENSTEVTKQEKIIGKHPENGIFYLWTECEDTKCTSTKRHRSLLAKLEKRDYATDEVAKWVVNHHLSSGKKMKLELQRKKQILDKYELSEYAEELHVFPRNSTTKKGNLGEIFLTEYLSEANKMDKLIYRLRYNTNVDQSLKGDDVLLIKGDKIIVGESKYRGTPSKNAVNEATSLMNKCLILPLSLNFIADRLFEQGKEELALEIFELELNASKYNIDIKNVAFLFSNHNVKGHVEKNLCVNNDNFAFISFGIHNPNDFVEAVFEKAKEILGSGDYNYED